MGGVNGRFKEFKLTQIFSKSNYLSVKTGFLPVSPNLLKLSILFLLHSLAVTAFVHSYTPLNLLREKNTVLTSGVQAFRTL